MPSHCPTCGSPDLRTSHFRRSDIGRLLLLQYPMRCRTCRERSFGFLLRMIAMKKHGELRKR
jgi:hypothetical protein